MKDKERHDLSWIGRDGGNNSHAVWGAGLGTLMAEVFMGNQGGLSSTVPAALYQGSLLV